MCASPRPSSLRRTRCSPKQLEAAGLRRVPDAYVFSVTAQRTLSVAGHGFRRATSVCTWTCSEIGGKSRDPEALRFIIGHEVAAIAAGHVGYFRLIFTTLFSQIPVLSSALSRSQEYTADNFGYRFSPRALRVLSRCLRGQVPEQAGQLR